MGKAKHRTDAAEARRILRSALRALRTVSRREETKDRATAQLELELAKSVELTARSDVVEGGLGNRTAIESYRNVTLAGLMKHVNNLGLVGRRFGAEGGRFAARTGIRADLAVLYATGPQTIDEARARDLVRVLVSNPASAQVLAGDRVWHERFREDLINLAVGSGAETSTWELVVRSAERSDSGNR